YMGGLSQAFPAARSRDRRALAEAEEARALAAESVEVGRALFLEVAHACVDWSAAEALRRSIAGHRELFEAIREAALARYGTGGASLGMVARTEAALAGIDRQLVEAELESEVARAALEALSAGLAPLPRQAPPLRDFDRTLEVERLVAAALAARGDREATEARAGAASARSEAARAEGRAPSFEVRASYMQSPSMSPGLGAMVSMSLPWLWGGAGARREAAEADAIAARADIEARERVIRVEVTRAVSRLMATRRALELLVTRELPAAQQAAEAERAALASGRFDLLAWTDAAHALETALHDAVRLRGALGHASIDLQASTGER
ncbi:MAG: TolC family protein, partial [Polyangiaceae bacterium]|nr:TolC family protein [Polyangiaceae bacterium]